MLLALSPLLITTLVFVVLSIVIFIAAISALRSRRWIGGALVSLLGLLLLAVAALAATIAIGVQGYRALTHEQVAAAITVQRLSHQTFRANVRFPDGRIALFELSGDEFYVDAHILKWHPIANILGLHTSYELDRIAGRYTDLEDEQTKRRTVYSLAEDKAVNMFHLARRFRVLAPLVDAEYGSGTFAPTAERSEWEVRVSTSGLLLRRVGQERRR